jgi:hemolysin III
MVPPSPLKWVLRRFDHSAIYIMIAGTYTAIVVHFDNVTFAAILAGIVWTGAILGAVVKIALPGRYDRLAVVTYIALGWVGVAAIGPAREALPGPSLVLLVLGGITYVAGVAFYSWHRLRFHNAIWHLFVAVAAALHFVAIAIAVAA